jgi:hypothetical protein
MAPIPEHPWAYLSLAVSRDSVGADMLVFDMAVCPSLQSIHLYAEAVLRQSVYHLPRDLERSLIK